MAPSVSISRTTSGEPCARRDLRLELPERRWHLERDLLPGKEEQDRRRARVLRRALRHRRGELQLLPGPRDQDDAGLGEADARAVRVLAEAVPEVHPSRHVPEGD